MRTQPASNKRETTITLVKLTTPVNGSSLTSVDRDSGVTGRFRRHFRHPNPQPKLGGVLLRHCREPKPWCDHEQSFDSSPLWESDVSHKPTEIGSMNHFSNCQRIAFSLQIRHESMLFSLSRPRHERHHVIGGKDFFRENLRSRKFLCCTSSHFVSISTLLSI